MDACTCHTVHCSNIDTHTHNQSKVAVCVFMSRSFVFLHTEIWRWLSVVIQQFSAAKHERYYTHKHIAYNRVSIAAEDITWLTLHFLKSYPNPNHHHCLLMYTQCIYIYTLCHSFSFLNSLLCLSLACSGPAWRVSGLQELNHFCWPSVVRFGPKASALHWLKSWK